MYNISYITYIVIIIKYYTYIYIEYGDDVPIPI